MCNCNNKRSNEVEVTKNMKNVDLEDLLEEDPIISSQQYAIISYILPEPGRNDLDRVLFKFRGAYPTVEKCKKQAEKLTKYDDSDIIPLNFIETGKWGRLESPEDIANKDIDIEYRDSLMNEMMQGYQSQKGKTVEDDANRKAFRSKQLKFDGTKEGQKLLNEVEEHLVSIQDRLARFHAELKDNQELQIYADKKVEYHTALQVKLQTIKETDSDIKFSELIRTDIVKNIDTELAQCNKEREILNKRIQVLIDARKEKTDTSITKYLEDNDLQVRAAIDNQKYLVEKISSLRIQIKDTEKVIEKKTANNTIKQLSPDAISAIVNSKGSVYGGTPDPTKIKLGKVDDYIDSFDEPKITEL